jgi:hypothetical protein
VAEQCRGERSLPPALVERAASLAEDLEEVADDVG